ncbi:MAG: ferredoxin [Candidatus Nealsonbacteria bacterium]|nr:ferredoxin [Candidatus Nealsonbacteria bacterium]
MSSQNYKAYSSSSKSIQNLETNKFSSPKKKLGEWQVNKEQCLGCGLCESLCPEIFEMKDGKSQIKNGADFDKNKTCLIEAVEACPAKAIVRQ